MKLQERIRMRTVINESDKQEINNNSESDAALQYPLPRRVAEGDTAITIAHGREHVTSCAQNRSRLRRRRK